VAVPGIRRGGDQKRHLAYSDSNKGIFVVDEILKNDPFLFLMECIQDKKNNGIVLYTAGHDRPHLWLGSRFYNICKK